MSRSMSRTGMFLKKQLWIWPVIAVVVLAIIGYAVRSAVESTMKANLATELQTLLAVDVAALETWLDQQLSIVGAEAQDADVRKTVLELTDEEKQPTGPALVQSPLHKQLRRELSPTLLTHDFAGYLLFDQSQRVVSASNDELIGRNGLSQFESNVSRGLRGETTLCPPFASPVVTKDRDGKLRTGVPVMYLCAPVRDDSFQVVAVLALEVRPDRDFTRILQLARLGETGETYAFNRDAVMVSNSRFEDKLKQIGLLTDDDETHSMLNVQLRNPQVDMTAGERPELRRSKQPLTNMAASAIAGHSGVNVEGYSDYRGARTVSAWTWMPKFELGVATKMDYAEAYRPLNILRWTFWGLYSLLGASAIAIFVFTVIVARLQRTAQKAAMEAKQLGQYSLEQKLGSGGMGVVYKGHHAMLRRPTAIKMLDVDKTNEDSIRRFEREVQITCQLNHPNTVAIYDFGRTPEGLFYYAMEYLDGIDLQNLVDRHGPQSEGRVISILTQVCGSLFEAHSLGLVHRDIKPANIMLNRRGGVPDLVKVLDFGLVKAIDEARKGQTSSSGGLTGTPLYMSPEAIQRPDSVDARGDLYAVGAVGYFLLTGTPVFRSESVVELCRQHVLQAPEPPSERLGRSVTPELEAALLACLEKDPSRRPQTARELAVRLEKCATAHEWSMEKADGWWSRYSSGTLTATLNSSASRSGFDQTIIGGKVVNGD
ncbi:serine/threonine protein kinase [Planctellipticum variicoloris]|uniref:serine/threonine protein kinase n=1 Tax=Planctellipticum variicoloris TaxID=3064265 RepID=UPI0030134CFB|nr:serine/threonine protein kinase [Planctomycetaceae bacterium SH412]